MESTKSKLLPLDEIRRKEVLGYELNPIDYFLLNFESEYNPSYAKHFKECLSKALNHETEEDKMLRNGEVVASFINHCEENGLTIPESFYESYFNA